MANLGTLPDEVLLVILRHAPHDSLPALALLRKSLYRCANPRIYHFVHFSEPKEYWGHTEPDFPDWSRGFHQSLTTFGDGPRRDSRVVQISLFLRTISHSKTIRSYIKAASFIWRTEKIEKTVRQVLGVLAPCRPLLHLSPAEYPLSFICPFPITSMQVRAADLRATYSDPQVDPNDLYQLFCIPHLRSLCFTRVRSWRAIGMPSFNRKSRTSDISCLSFPDSVPSRSDLNEVLTWPKALKSFHHYTCPSNAMFGPYERGMVSVLDFIQALRPQRETMEEICLTGSVGNEGSVLPKTIDLRAFPRLRRAGLPIQLLAMSNHGRACYKDIFRNEEIPTMSEILSPDLEELQIELPREFSFSSFFQATPPEDLKLEGGEFSAWLCEIARNKELRHPALHRVVLWQNNESDDDKEHFNPRLEAGCGEVMAAFKSARVSISWVVNQRPPLFSA